MDKKYIPLLFALVPAIVILAFLASKLYTVSTGTEILLETAPVDPRDLFRGDYVILSYGISSVSGVNSSDFKPGDSIYASLSKKEKFWTIDTAGRNRPELAQNQVCLKGEVSSIFSDILRVSWGIESYFVPEGEGRPIERQRVNLSVTVIVDSDCRGIVKELLINDTAVKFG